MPQVEVIWILALGKVCKPLYDASCTFLSANISIKLKKKGRCDTVTYNKKHFIVYDIPRGT